MHTRRDLFRLGAGLSLASVTTPALAARAIAAPATGDAFLDDPRGVLEARLSALAQPPRRDRIGHVSIAARYRELDQLAAHRDAVDVRSFGARLDGVTDDTAAFQAAADSAAPVLRITGGGALRLTRAVRIGRPLTVIGDGENTPISYEGGEAAFLVSPLNEADTALFLRDVRFDRLFIESTPGPRHATAVLAHNVRGISLTRSTVKGLAGLIVRHRLQPAIKLRGDDAPRSPDIDPAVEAGFSPHAPDDLNEDVVFIDNMLDARHYMAFALRTEFAAKIVAAYNRCRFSNISWWGGGARRFEGGELHHMRRVRELHAVGNAVHGSLGGIYGNNGQNVVVEDNHVEDVLDAGIDFEGCIDAIARNNVVIDAGNYPYSTFYGARNVRFSSNVGIQTGRGASAPARFDTRAIGNPTGRFLFALRSAGFAGRDMVDVAFDGNIFAFTGKEGLGSVLPSYNSILDVSDNSFLNVRCDLTYGRSGDVSLVGNRFVFDQPPDSAETLVGLGGSGPGTQSRIVDNKIRIGTSMPEGTIALALAQNRANETTVTGNTVAGSTSSLEAGFALKPWNKPISGERPQVRVSDNNVPSIVDFTSRDLELETQDNADTNGIALKPQRRLLPGLPTE